MQAAELRTVCSQTFGYDLHTRINHTHINTHTENKKVYTHIHTHTKQSKIRGRTEFKTLVPPRFWSRRSSTSKRARIGPTDQQQHLTPWVLIKKNIHNSIFKFVVLHETKILNDHCSTDWWYLKLRGVCPVRMHYSWSAATRGTQSKSMGWMGMCGVKRTLGRYIAGYWRFSCVASFYSREVYIVTPRSRNTKQYILPLWFTAQLNRWLTDDDRVVRTGNSEWVWGWSGRARLDWLRWWAAILIAPGWLSPLRCVLLHLFCGKTCLEMPRASVSSECCHFHVPLGEMVVWLGRRTWRWWGSPEWPRDKPITQPRSR